MFLLPILWFAFLAFSFVGEMIEQLSNGQGIPLNSVLWVGVSCFYIYQCVRFIWKQWRPSSQTVIPEPQPEQEAPIYQSNSAKFSSFIKSIFKIFFAIFIGLPVIVVVVGTIVDLGIRLLGPEAPILLIFLAMPAYMAGSAGVRRFKTWFDTRRETLAQGKWESTNKQTTKIEIVIRGILLVLLFPPIFVVSQFAFLSLQALVNNPLRFAISPDDVFGNILVTVIYLVMFLPAILLLIALCWLAYKLASRLARVITYVIGLQKEYQRLEAETTSPVIATEDEIDGLQKKESQHNS
jgi:hypothetical protein